RHRREIDEDLAILHLHFVARNSRRNARSGFTGQALKLPVMPRANDISVVAQGAVPQWAADMIADTRNRAEFAITIGKCNRMCADLELLKRLIDKLHYGAETMPIWFLHFSPLRRVSSRLAAWEGSAN